MLLDIPVTSIRPSPTNPRKTFRKLDELAASLTAVGQIDPVTVRPLPKDKANGITHELVVGERRWRAAPLAKLKTLKAIVRELDDKQVAEIQIVENDQREDIHPLEQADGYQALLKLGYSVEQIAAKVSRTGEFVRKRLALCNLIHEAKAALQAEKILPGVAMLIARIPDSAAQKKALEKVLPEEEEHWPEGEKKPMKLDGPTCTVERARLLLREHFMLKLSLAPFDRADAKLVGKAGACTTCPKRTGSQTELFSDIDSPDLCTDPGCFKAKVVAHWQVVKSKAKETQQPILSEAQSKSVFVDDSKYGREPTDQVQYGSGFVRADTLRWSGDKNKTAKEIVGPDVKPTLALAPNGMIVELYPRDLVDKSERAHVRDYKLNGSGSSSPKSDPIKNKKDLEQAGRRAVFGAIAAKASKVTLSDPHLKLLIMCFGGAHEWRLEEVVKRRELGKGKPKGSKEKGLIVAAAAGMKGGELIGLLFEIALAFNGEKPALDAAAKLFKVDADQVDQAGRAAFRAEKKSKAVTKPSKGKSLKAAAAKAKPAKPIKGAKK